MCDVAPLYFIYHNIPSSISYNVPINIHDIQQDQHVDKTETVDL